MKFARCLFATLVAGAFLLQVGVVVAERYPGLNPGGSDGRCEQRCNDVKDRCIDQTTSFGTDLFQGMLGKCLNMQMRCNTEENAKVYQGGFPDLARCQTIGNECNDQVKEQAESKKQQAEDRCNANYERCMANCY